MLKKTENVDFLLTDIYIYMSFNPMVSFYTSVIIKISCL